MRRYLLKLISLTHVQSYLLSTYNSGCLEKLQYFSIIQASGIQWEISEYIKCLITVICKS